MPRSMKRNIPTAIAFTNFNSALGEAFRRSEHVCRFGVTSESDNWRVLEQKKDIANSSIFAERHQSLLQAQSDRVINRAELENRDHFVIC